MYLFRIISVRVTNLRINTPVRVVPCTQPDTAGRYNVGLQYSLSVDNGFYFRQHNLYLYLYGVSAPTFLVS